MTSRSDAAFAAFDARAFAVSSQEFLQKSTQFLSLVKLKGLGIKLAMLTVVDGRIVGTDPDLVGTNHGHLCQQPAKVAEFEAQQRAAVVASQLRRADTGTESTLSGQSFDCHIGSTLVPSRHAIETPVDALRAVEASVKSFGRANFVDARNKKHIVYESQRYPG